MRYRSKSEKTDNIIPFEYNKRIELASIKKVPKLCKLRSE